MLSFAMVSLSPCSAAISSRSGATILHGPHHSAQKSTSTGLSLPSTSAAKLVSVTITGLPAMEVRPLGRLGGDPGCLTSRGTDVCPRPRPGGSALAEGVGEPAFGVDRGRGAGTGGGDRLAVDVIDH